MGLRAYIDDLEVVHELERYGQIKSDVIRLKYKTGHDLAGLENGNRLVRMILTEKSIPYSIKIASEWCRIIHSNQKPICNICNEEGHRRSACHNIICFKCGAAGHMRSACPEQIEEDRLARAATRERIERIEREQQQQDEQFAQQLSTEERTYYSNVEPEEEMETKEHDTGYDSSKESPAETMKNLGYTERDKIQATPKPNNVNKKPTQAGSKREHADSSDKDHLVRRPRIKPSPNINMARKKPDDKDKTDEAANTNS